MGRPAVGDRAARFLGFALVVLVGWSRIELRDHTRNQVIAGTVLGTLVSAAGFAVLR